MNYGSVSIDGQNFLQGGIQFFAINSNPVETIKVPKNCLREQYDIPLKRTRFSDFDEDHEVHAFILGLVKERLDPTT